MKAQLILFFCSFLAWAGPSASETPWAEEVIAELVEEGYTVTQVRRSWLGRVIITAENGEDLREVVLNRASGDVMRDRIFAGAAEGRGGLEAGTRPDLGARPERTERPERPERPEGGGGGGGPKH